MGSTRSMVLLQRLEGTCGFEGPEDFAHILNESGMQNHKAYAITHAGHSTPQVDHKNLISGVQDCLVIDFEYLDDKNQPVRTEGVFRGALSPGQPFWRLFDARKNLKKYFCKTCTQIY